ncbi:cytochrome P450 2D28-like [Glandiceps talaboti]
MAGILLSLLCLCLCLVYKFIYTPRPQYFPPGPDGLPIIGCVIPVLRNPISAFKQYAAQYGNVFSIKIGPTYIIVCHKMEANREVLVNKGNDFAGRPEIFIKSFGAGGNGIITRPVGKGLSEQKKFALRCMRCLGLQGESLERRIQNEAVGLYDLLKSTNGRAVNVGRFLQLGTANVMCSIAFGKRCKYDDLTLKYLLDHLDEQFNTNPFKFLFQVARIIPRPIRKRLSFIDLASPTEKIVAYLEKIINEHKNTFDPQTPRDMIDAFLEKQEKLNSGMHDDDKASYGSFTDDQLKYLLLDFFLAGTETTATTLNWAVLYMVLYPHVQDKVQQELDQVLREDPNAVVSLKDRTMLPYTSATLLEIQRIRPVAPLGTPHSAVMTSSLGEYVVPKDSVVITDLWSVSMDEKFWTAPSKFNPNRMIDENGEVTKPESFLPFSTGPRACLGEQLAKSELFIFFCTLMHRFHFEIPQGESRPTDDPHIGISLSPTPYKVCIKQRL